MKKILCGFVVSSLLLLTSQSAEALGPRIRVSPESSTSTSVVKFLELSDLFYSLRLTEEQKIQIAFVLEANRSDVRSSLEGMLEGAKGLSTAIHAPTFDEQAIRTAHQSFSAQAEEFAVLRGKILSEVRPILTAQQSAQINKFKKNLSAAVQARLKSAQKVISNWIQKYLPEGETE